VLIHDSVSLDREEKYAEVRCFELEETQAGTAMLIERVVRDLPDCRV
jgi:hypothetical protein